MNQKKTYFEVGRNLECGLRRHEFTKLVADSKKSGDNLELAEQGRVLGHIRKI